MGIGVRDQYSFPLATVTSHDGNQVSPFIFFFFGTLRPLFLCPTFSTLTVFGETGLMPPEEPFSLSSSCALGGILFLRSTVVEVFVFPMSLDGFFVE